jgi:hypothetical protein
MPGRKSRTSNLSHQRKKRGCYHPFRGLSSVAHRILAFETLEGRRLLAADSLGHEFWLTFQRNSNSSGGD